MRRLSAAIAMSVTGHVAAIAWIVCGGEVLTILRPDPPAAITARAAEPAPAEAISLVLLDERRASPEAPPAPASEAPPPRPPAPRAPGTAPGAPGAAPPRAELAISTGTATTGELPRDAPGHSPWMTMRPPAGPPPSGLSPEFIQRFLEHSRPLVPQARIPDEDSAADLAGEPDVHGNIVAAEHGATWRHIARAWHHAEEELQPAAGGSYQADRPTFTARIGADGTAHLEDKLLALDTQDHLMMRYGSDPYARAKLAFLDRTRDQRAAIAGRHTHEQLARSAELMQENIDRLWATTRDLAERKRELFELWDDCVETGSDELVAGGTAARALVIGVIRARLRGADAYSAAELAQLNAIRHSTVVFDPYDGSPQPAP